MRSWAARASESGKVESTTEGERPDQDEEPALDIEIGPLLQRSDQPIIAFGVVATAVVTHVDDEFERAPLVQHCEHQGSVVLQTLIRVEGAIQRPICTQFEAPNRLVRVLLPQRRRAGGHGTQRDAFADGRAAKFYLRQAA